MRTLPRKNVIRERGKRILACVILDTWLRKESTVSAHLRQLLADAGVASAILDWEPEHVYVRCNESGAPCSTMENNANNRTQRSAEVGSDTAPVIGAAAVEISFAEDGQTELASSAVPNGTVQPTSQ